MPISPLRTSRSTLFDCMTRLNLSCIPRFPISSLARDKGQKIVQPSFQVSFTFVTSSA